MTNKYVEFESRASVLWPEADVEVRSVGDGLEFEGYALPFNKWSEPIPGGARGSFREAFREGSLDRTLARNPDIVLSTQHSLVSLPLARTSAGTMTLTTDSYGLLAKGSLPDNELGRPVRDSIRRKDIRGMSIRFRIPSRAGEKWSSNYSEREVLDAQLGQELSFVTFPAYADTTAAVRQLAEMAELEPDALAEAFDVLREPERRLSPEQAKLIYAAVASKADEPHVTPKVAALRDRLAELAISK